MSTHLSGCQMMSNVIVPLVTLKPRDALHAFFDSLYGLGVSISVSFFWADRIPNGHLYSPSCITINLKRARQFPFFEHFLLNSYYFFLLWYLAFALMRLSAHGSGQPTASGRSPGSGVGPTSNSASGRCRVKSKSTGCRRRETAMSADLHYTVSSVKRGGYRRA